MKKVVIFNHKGGVSKTTTTFNIGWKLALMGHRVLIVDADPQCNLTSLFLGNEFDEYFTNEQTRLNNIKDGVSNAFDGRPIVIKGIDCPNAHRNVNLYLLPGHMNLSEYDGALNFALTAANSLPSLRSLPGSFNDLIEKTCQKYNIDYAFIDLNPGLSPLNQVLFLTGDAFIIPINPDTFSMMALKSLSKILPNWVRWKRDNMALFKDSAYPLPDGTPKFIGVIPQRFNIRNGVPTNPYKVQIDNLLELIQNEVIEKFRQEDMLFSNTQYNSAGISMNKNLSEIKDFQGLAPKSQKYNVPIFELRDEELEATGAALEGMKNNREYFGDLYGDICNKITSLLS